MVRARKKTNKQSFRTIDDSVANVRADGNDYPFFMRNVLEISVNAESAKLASRAVGHLERH